MSEITRIITARITIIEKGDNICSKEDEADIAKTVIKDMLNADDVVIDNVQDFVMGE